MRLEIGVEASEEWVGDRQVIDLRFSFYTKTDRRIIDSSYDGFFELAEAFSNLSKTLIKRIPCHHCFAILYIAI